MCFLYLKDSTFAEDVTRDLLKVYRNYAIDGTAGEKHG